MNQTKNRNARMAAMQKQLNNANAARQARMNALKQAAANMG